MSRPSQIASRFLVFLTTVFVFVLSVFTLSTTAAAQEGPLDKSQPKGITVDEIIKRFAAKEKEFKAAREQYTFRQDVKVMTLDGDTVGWQLPICVRREL